MSIRFACPDCGKKLEAEERFSGRGFDCPRCARRLTIPEQLPVPVPPGVPRSTRRLREAAPEPSLVAPPHPINFEDLIDMTAMVDIVFFLLIFFLVTSMHALDSTIPMPPPNPEAGSGGAGGSTTVSAEAEDLQVIVNIDRNDVIRIEGTEISGPRDLLFKLREIRNGPGRPEKLLVVGSGDASHGTTVMVLDAGHDVGMESVRLAVRDDVE
ncbi:MAG TPA: biopolymer transporter ExbD [Planctomycetaceae bacterium]|nr:biopolymer transporter ExbD [Planctomycetaceae bacterium]